MSYGTRRVFLGHPITSVGERQKFDTACGFLTKCFMAEQWEILPRKREEREALVGLTGEAHRDVVASNIRSILESDVLVLLIDKVRACSSIWVEAGIAMASGVPGVVIAKEEVAVPYLVMASCGDNPFGEIAPWRRLEADLFTKPPEVARSLASGVVNEIIRWVEASKVNPN